MCFISPWDSFCVVSESACGRLPLKYSSYSVIFSSSDDDINDSEVEFLCSFLISFVLMDFVILLNLCTIRTVKSQSLRNPSSKTLFYRILCFFFVITSVMHILSLFNSIFFSGSFSGSKAAIGCYSVDRSFCISSLNWN